MARKRGPGAGRKRIGKEPAVHFNTRIDPEIRQWLEQEAERNKRSLSQEIARRLRDSVDLGKQQKQKGPPAALGRLIAHLASGVERATGGRRWRNDAFTGEALRTAIDVVLQRLIPTGPIEIPETVKQNAEALARTFPAEQVKFYTTPEGVGRRLALGLLDQIEIAERPPLNAPSNERYSDSFYLLPRLKEDLEL